jgi:O-methyltransferase involved in polyketide biosynthesis
MRTIHDPEAPLSDCQKKLQPIIQKDKEGKYFIPQDLMLQHLPQEVVDSFLDFINQHSPEHQSILLELIKSGKIKIVCE